jgi:hypothetical protein
MQVCDTVPPRRCSTRVHLLRQLLEPWLEHSRRCVLKQIERFKLNEKSLVVELASNDGYLLKNYVEKRIPVLGIDPCKGPVQAALKIGRPDDARVLHAGTWQEAGRRGARRQTSFTRTT